jgi:hypothetical protein
MFVDAQQTNALSNIYLQLGNEAKHINLKIPLAFIIGNNQGGDQVLGRHISYGMWAKPISHNCDGTSANYLYIDKDYFSFLEMEDIKELVLAEAWHELEDLYQAQCWNLFFDVDYGVNIWGIFLTACPPEAPLLSFQYRYT